MAKLPEFKIEIIDLLRYPTIAELGERLAVLQPNMEHRGQLTEPGIINDDLLPSTDFDFLVGFPTAKILEKIVPFNEVLYKDCFYNAFFPVIRHFDQEIESFLADDLTLYEYHPDNEDPKLEINYHSLAGIERLLDQLGIGIITKPSSARLIPDLIQALADGHPVIIRVDCFYEPNRYDMFQENHWEHCLLIYGYDQTTQVFHCLEHDDLNSLTYKPLMIGYYHLLNAYRGYLRHFHQDPAQPSFYEFSRLPVDPSAIPVDHPAAIRRHVIVQKTRLLNQLESLRLFQADWQRLISDPAKLATRVDPLVHLVNQILKAKTAQDYQIKQLFAAQASDMTERLTEIITAWNYLKVTVEKYKYSHRFRAEEFAAAGEKLAEIARLEDAFLQILITKCEE